MMNDHSGKIRVMQARLVERQVEILQACIADCQGVAEEFRAQASFWCNEPEIARAYEDCAEKLEAVLEQSKPATSSPVAARVSISIAHEGEALEVGGRHGMPRRPVRWPANPAGNFGCVQVPMEAAAEAEKMKQLAKLVNAGVIAPEEYKAMSIGEFYDFGQPTHCRCDVQVNHSLLPTIQEKYNHLKDLVRSYFDQLSNIYDFGRGSHDSFINARQLSTQIVKILDEKE